MSWITVRFCNYGNHVYWYDRLPTLPFEPLRILAMKMNIVHIATRVHQNLHVGKTLWDKTTHMRKAIQLLQFGSNWLENFYMFFSPLNIYSFERYVVFLSFPLSNATQIVITICAHL
jgi:hypothetical protein